MNDISSQDHRRAFSLWLRTGRLPAAVTADGIELKFNPWHDPETGRFTFAGGGRSYGGWGDRFTGGGGGNFDGGGSAGSWGRGGSGGGGGASGSWGTRERRSRPNSTRPATATTVASSRGARGRAVPTGAPSRVSDDDGFRTVVRNGYVYEIDARERKRRVSGALTLADRPVRSRAAQARAGGPERRSTDDGGHYIAARFNGPTEAFNHFAQDAGFNRGRYRLLEDQLAREKRAGKRVAVKIVPHFEGPSVRPAAIDVSWIVDGYRRSLKLPNARSEKPRGKR